MNTISIYNRIDGLICHFKCSHINQRFMKKHALLQSKNNKEFARCIKASGTKMRGMYLYGSTTGWSRYPLFIVNNKRKMLPRPVVNSRCGSKGFELMKCYWFTELTKYVEDFTLQFVEEMCTKTNHSFLKIKEDLLLSKQLIPDDLRICGTFFTAVSVILPKQGKITHTHIHIDRNDVISCLLYLGKDVIGGDLMFFDGLYQHRNNKSIGEFVHWKQFQHGRLISGEFRKIYHGSSNWYGERTVIVFYTSRKVLKHFKQYGNYYYKRYQFSKHPNKFFCTNGVRDITDESEMSNLLEKDYISVS